MLDNERPRIVSKELTEDHGIFVVEPLERGFGTTLGNCLPVSYTHLTLPTKA